ncbi:LamG domain-containing protein [Ginsengibacter hankyongi]|uniref:LamG domain-containing protein n=1 Tax=Ginsengibacter hankyongi TaxID=2607284 RepID=A0A5J5IAM4_9BACT|nr:LamG domain-containing protein [Ginsengibacter hankyongi]KAA9035636.1 LamG domain-containing protein [Ginsengibacter hankyongi]
MHITKGTFILPEIGLKTFFTILAAVLIVTGATGQVDFGAYYTKINTGQNWEAYSRTGSRADIIVKLSGAGGQIVFWRGNSYLPYWKTDQGQWNFSEIISRTGNGTSEMPDRANVYSHAEIIQNSPKQIIIQWRYLSQFAEGNPHKGVNPDNFVEETFTIAPDGMVKREVKTGTVKIDEWNDPAFKTTQKLQLRANGIRQISISEPRHSLKEIRVKGNRATGPVVVRPKIWFSFDEGLGDNVSEKIHKIKDVVPGNKTLWKKGISGTSLDFDGYNTVVSIPPVGRAVASGESLTLEGWIALGAYPWNWAPLVQQGDNDGYFLGVDSHGYPGVMIKIDTTWEKLSVPNKPPYNDANHLALFRWYNLAASYDKTQGVMRLFLDGKEIASKSVGKSGVRTVNTDIRIGKAGIMRTPTEGTHDTYPSNFGIDGLIDEVQIYDVALNNNQIAETYRNFFPGKAIANSPDLQKRKFPAPSTNGEFKGVYTHLPYYETWENMFRFGKFADVVVGFDKLPIKYVFWRGVSYIPMIVNESGQWFTNQFDETGFTKDAPGDCEPMSDKGCWDSQVRIIENTPARVVVNWRYRQADPSHHWANYDSTTGWGDISDWDYYIYPDGVACKVMKWYSSKPEEWHEWDEQIAVLSEGQHPESVLKKTPVMTLVDTSGKSVDYDWNPNPPKPNFKGTLIQKINYTGKYDPYSIQNFTDGDIYKGERTWYSVFPSWNHWPTAQINSSGRNASFPDRASHSSISHLYWNLYKEKDGKAAYQEDILMEGMTDKRAVSLTNLAKSWLNAPSAVNISGGKSFGYNPAHRAYSFIINNIPLKFQIAGSNKCPMHNLCFEIKNWNSRTVEAGLKINGNLIKPGANFRQGTFIDSDGTCTLIIWVQMDASSLQSFEVSKVRS